VTTGVGDFTGTPRRRSRPADDGTRFRLRITAVCSFQAPPPRSSARRRAGFLAVFRAIYARGARLATLAGALDQGDRIAPVEPAESVIVRIGQRPASAAPDARKEGDRHACRPRASLMGLFNFQVGPRRDGERWPASRR